MEPREPKNPDNEADDPLRRLEQRIERASEAAERLISEAARSAQPPPSGWQAPPSPREGQRQPADLELLVQLVRSLRELIPPELERRLAEALRELLLAIRALIDWYLERTERRREESGEVQDIPIM